MPDEAIRRFTRFHDYDLDSPRTASSGRPKASPMPHAAGLRSPCGNACIQLAIALRQRFYSGVQTFAVLGSTQVHDGDQPVELGGPLPRRLLTALVAAQGQPVSDDRLSESVWENQPPASPQAGLQVYVSRLRRALDDTGRDALGRTAVGYRLVTAPGATDVERFTKQIGTARLLSASGRSDESLPVFDAALRLWRGDPFADLPADPGVLAARAHLRELRDAAEEDRITARLALGQEASAVAELEGLVRAAPYRERRWTLLVLGLYRCGRQAEALAAVRRVRSLLADQLGVDPGPELQHLEQQVLRQDPDLLLSVRASPSRDLARQERIHRPLSSFLGRDADLALLAGLVAGNRLVTVVGTAGVGKTRLAIEHAAARTDGEGPWLVRLADVTDPAVLPSAVAAAAGVTEAAAATPDSLAKALCCRRGLFLLDNCEHLVDHVVPLVLCLLDQAPGLRVLATSRVPLGVDGERLLPLVPLPPIPAVALLIDRIRTLRPAWEPQERELDAVRHVATALDGIPLALELAAARAPVLGIQELAAHLGDRLAVLGRIPAGSLTPHTTLEAAIGWSVDLLPDPDRSMLLRLWPFEGGFPLEAVLSQEAGLETLSSLVSRSMVVADTTTAPGRYRLLEVIRAYCRAHDPAPGASSAAHAAFIHRQAAHAAQEMQGERSPHAIRMLTRELPNIWAAIAHDLTASPEAALRTAGLLLWFWVRSGLLVEGRRLLERCLAAAPHAPARDIARARMAHAGLEYVAGDGGHARETIAAVARALSAATDREDRALYAEARHYQALLQVPDGDPETALAAAADAYRIGTELGLDWLAANAEMARGAALLLLGRTADGRQALHAAIRRALACGVDWTAAVSEVMLAQSMLASGDPALPILRDALRRFRREGDLSNILIVLHNGAQALAADGQTERAEQLRAAAHHHITRRGMRLHQTFAGGHVPDGWQTGPRTASDDDPPSLAATIALFETQG
jgi:predicted ATPase/DNA-binding SARP family transcriptional activator